MVEMYENSCLELCAIVNTINHTRPRRVGTDRAPLRHRRWAITGEVEPASKALRPSPTRGITTAVIATRGQVVVLVLPVRRVVAVEAA